MSKPDLKSVEERVAPAPTPEQIKAILQADRLAREQRATAKIEKALQEERCIMEIQFRYSSLSGKFSTKNFVVALD